MKRLVSFTRKYLLQFGACILWYRGRLSSKTQSKVEFPLPGLGNNRKVLENVADNVTRTMSLYEKPPSECCAQEFPPGIPVSSHRERHIGWVR